MVGDYHHSSLSKCYEEEIYQEALRGLTAWTEDALCNEHHDPRRLFNYLCISSMSLQEPLPVETTLSSIHCSKYSKFLLLYRMLCAYGDVMNKGCNCRGRTSAKGIRAVERGVKAPTALAVSSQRSRVTQGAVIVIIIFINKIV
jgi:hypothetical protein